jgi:hypothetical protein
MKIARAHPLRKVVRGILAAAFWLHAAWAFSIFPAHFSTALASSIYFYNAALIGFILYYSYFSRRGWLSVIYDFVYIYFWPFVITCRASWLVSRAGFSFAKSKLKFPSLSLITEKAPVLDVPSAPAPEAPMKQPEDSAKESILNRLLRPLTQFCVLWSILILSVQNKIFLAFCCLVALAGSARALKALWALRLDHTSRTKDIKQKFADIMATRIAAIRGWEEGRDYRTLTESINAVRLYEAVLAFFEDNRDFLARCTLAAGVAITIPFYCYISTLFSFIYLGICKIQGISWDWPSALSSSLFMPFAYTDLPHSFPVRILGGIQCIGVAVMGWNIVSRHLSDRFESIMRAATELKQPFTEQTYRSKMQRLTVITAEAEAVKATMPATPRPKIGGARKQPKGANKTSQHTQQVHSLTKQKVS